MKKSLMTAVVAALALLGGQAFAADAACEAKAVSKDGKPLAGAAKTAFMKKCEKEAGAAAKTEATAACEAKALSKDGKPLAGAAKKASVKKCMADAGKK